MEKKGVEHLHHYWLAPNGPVLCSKFSDKTPPELLCPLGFKTIHLTIDKAIVNCQDCLELIHA